MAQPTDHLASLERQRLQLEDNISELKKSLYNWRMWDAEYDELKNDILALEETSTNEDLLRIGREFGGSLVNENEIKILLGVEQGVTRTQQQVVDTISRRRDYVQQNIGVLEKRISAAENKLDAILTVEHPDAVKEEGLPITDIIEELDDDDRVISSSTTTPDQAAPGILEVLEKAGMNDDLVKGKNGDKRPPLPLTKEGKNETSPQETEQVGNLDRSPSVAEIQPSEDISNSKSDTTTSVVQTAHPLSTTADSAARPDFNAPTTQIKDSNRSLVSEPSHDNYATTDIAINESPEDAALRREMLQYGLEEVGAVVAELELDESGSEFSIEDEDYLMSDEDDEEEDEYGRSTRRIIDDDYRRQMMELEKKLNARSLENVGPNTSVLPPEIRKELDSSRVNPIPNKTNDEAPKKKKKVAFADALDIAPGPIAPTPPAPTQEHRVEPPSVPVIRDAIVERAQAEKLEDIKNSTAPKKVSRFKNARTTSEPINLEFSPTLSAPAARSPAQPINTPPPLPLFPANLSKPKPFSQLIADPDDPPKILADTLVERAVSHENATPPDPDELDENLHKQEIATEFYKLRNRKVHQEGGFLREDEESDGIIPLDEEGLPPKKLSRFLAARMK
ncbi:hypothetical protein AJ78_02442 [Emergomyces pasteurianus Ep9510]|uniref:DUF3835 domain-containing protein n=1 Tax=Emergomyces pasteurianus Ep9510 TaxID=1447872 RepID=A0A1J9QQD7_9EURO|nr:hypothetical protein AJ78_02442 [Emergomyces pasteurianus Ep9510]